MPTPHLRQFTSRLSHHSIRHPKGWHLPFIHRKDTARHSGHRSGGGREVAVAGWRAAMAGELDCKSPEQMVGRRADCNP